jgi:hypothetical protein
LVALGKPRRQPRYRFGLRRLSPAPVERALASVDELVALAVQRLLRYPSAPRNLRRRLFFAQ